MFKISEVNVRKFKLSDNFISQYKEREVPWGPVGYITFKRTYARRLSEFTEGAEGTEEWYQTCRRVIEGMFDIQKRHVHALGLEWNDQKAQRTAKEATSVSFTLKWTPPGRGLWMMGTKFIYERTGAGLFNCAFRSTREIYNKGWLHLRLDDGCSYGWISVLVLILSVQVRVLSENHNTQKNYILFPILVRVGSSRSKSFSTDFSSAKKFPSLTTRLFEVLERKLEASGELHRDMAR